METTIKQFLRKLNCDVSSRYLNYVIKSHPDYPSLLAISDSTRNLGVKNEVVRMKGTDLSSLSFPFLVVNESKSKSVYSENLFLIDSEKKLSKYDLLTNDDEYVVLLAKRYSGANHTTHEKWLSYDKKINIAAATLISVFIIGSLVIAFYKSYWNILFISVTSWLGLALGVLVMAKEIGLMNNLLNKLCRTSDSMDCEKTIQSKVGFMGIKFTDATMIYFLFQTALLFAITLLPNAHWNIPMNYLAMISLGALPAALFSLYYQAFITKKWCRLCLYVDGVLFIQFIGLLKYLENFSFSYLWLFLTSILLPLVIATHFLIKFLILRQNSLDSYTQPFKALRVKYSKDVFSHLLLEQPLINESHFDHEFYMGNPGGIVKILMVTNLYCGPCRESHFKLHKILQLYPMEIGVRLRFVQSKDNVSIPYLLNYWVENEINTIQGGSQLLHDWFQEWNLEKFAEKFPLKKTVNVGDKLQTQHEDWLKLNEIKYTPTFYINGRKLPPNYSIDDLIYLMPCLLSED